MSPESRNCGKLEGRGCNGQISAAQRTRSYGDSLSLMRVPSTEERMRYRPSSSEISELEGSGQALPRSGGDVYRRVCHAYVTWATRLRRDEPVTPTAPHCFTFRHDVLIHCEGEGPRQWQCRKLAQLRAPMVLLTSHIWRALAHCGSGSKSTGHKSWTTWSGTRTLSSGSRSSLGMGIALISSYLYATWTARVFSLDNNLQGMPGIGKTTSIHCLAHQLLGDGYKEGVLELNASDERCVS